MIDVDRDSPRSVPRVSIGLPKPLDSTVRLAEIGIHHVVSRTCFLFDDVSGQLEGRLCSGYDLFDSITDVEGISTVSGSGSCGKKSLVTVRAGIISCDR